MAITVTQVRQIAKLPAAPILTDDAVQLYINAANIVYGDIPSESSGAWTTEKQDLVKLYLAAHFAVLSEEYGGFTQQVVGESEEHYQRLESANGLATTRFGKTAIALDDSGHLGSTAAKPLKALFRVFDSVAVNPLYPWIES